MKKSLVPIYSFILLLLIISCSKKNNDDQLTYQVSKLKHGYYDSYAFLLEQNQTSVNTLNSKINSFYNLPVIANFQQSKDSWLNANENFLLIGPYRYISSTQNPFNGNESYFDLYPINPSFIDYTATSPGSGIVSDAVNYPSITSYNLEGWHLQGSATNATVGYHCIEFMLWGEDNNTNGPGQRIHQDFVGNGTTEARRRQYLYSASLSLQQKTSTLSIVALKESLIQSSPKATLKLMFDGLLSYIKNDVAEKCLLTPYNSQSQADEISQFSDNTNSDIKTKIRAISLYLDPRPLFVSHSDYYLIDFIKEKDSDTYDKVSVLLETLSNEAGGWQNSFDNALTNSSDRAKIYQLYQHLIELHSLLDAFASKFE